VLSPSTCSRSHFSESSDRSCDGSVTWPEAPWNIGEASPAGYTHGKAAQRSTKDQAKWLHLRPCLAPSCCGTSGNYQRLLKTVKYFESSYNRCSPRTRPVARFEGAKYIFRGGTIFVFIKFLKQIFLGTRKFGGHKRYLGWHCPWMPPQWLRACGEPPQRRNGCENGFVLETFKIWAAAFFFTQITFWSVEIFNRQTLFALFCFTPRFATKKVWRNL